MLGLDRLNGTQKAILGLSTTFVVCFSILVVVDFADGSFDEPYHLYYILGFALLFSLATFTSYVVFNIGSLLAVGPNLLMPFLPAGIAVALTIDRARERKQPDS